MALPSSGAISLNEIHIEAGGSSGSQVSLNDSDVRDIKELSSGASSSFNDFYGAKAPYTITMTVGGTSLFIDGGDYGTDDTQRYRGYAKGSDNSNYPGSTAYGSLSVASDSDYFSGTELVAQAGKASNNTNGTVTASMDVIARVKQVNGNVQTNSDAMFKKVTINGTTLNRTDATFTSGGVGGIPSQWVWTLSNQSIPGNNTSAMGIYPASGSTCEVKFRGQ